MKEELFINGERVDLGIDTKITLNFNSNILGDISKIVSSNSYTINLPKTVRNRRVLDNPCIPAYSGTFIRKYNNARYVKNGVEIIKNGNAFLLNVGSDYEIALTWGSISGFQEWAAESKNLNELEEVDHFTDSYLIYRYAASSYKSNAGYLYSVYNTGIKLTTELKKLDDIHPSVRVPWILKRIQETYGFKLSYPTNKRIDEMIVPLINDSGARFTSIGGVWNFKAASGDNRAQFNGPVTSGNINFSNFGLTSNIEGTAVIYFECIVNVPIKIYINDGEAADVPYSFANNKYYYSYDKESNISVSIGDVISVKSEDGTNLLFSDKVGTMSLKIILDKVRIGDMYPIIVNLPEIKQVDFLKAICCMTGLFAVKDLQNIDTIKLVSVEDIINNKSIAKNWSDKLVPESFIGGPKKISYTFGDYSQNNALMYKEDDSVRISDTGMLYVDNDLIEKDKVLVTLPFSASDADLIRHYELSDDKLTINSKKVNPRIMLERNSGGISALTFNGLGLKELVDRNYSAFQDLIKEPVVITDIFRLNEIDLKELDFTVPVYIKQYGRYYGIIKIQAGSDDLCECELLQL